MRSIEDARRDYTHLQNDRIISAASCGVNHLTLPARDAMTDWLNRRASSGVEAFSDPTVGNTRSLFTTEMGTLLGTERDNISFVSNVNEGLLNISTAMLMKCFPERPQVLLYRHEYPSNVFPWTRPGSPIGFDPIWVEGEVTPSGKPLKFDLNEIEQALFQHKGIKIVSVSAVQFESGFKVDLQRLGEICRDRNVWFCVDAAQSLGADALSVDRIQADALLSSGWKWLGGPEGSSVMYTSPQLREWLERPGFPGPDNRKEGSYSSLSYTPAIDGKAFEPSTVHHGLMRGLSASVNSYQNAIGMDRIEQQIDHLQDLFLTHLDPFKFRLAQLQPTERGGILSFETDADPDQIMGDLRKERIILPAPRGGYLRVALHWFVTDEEVERLANALNRKL